MTDTRVPLASTTPDEAADGGRITPRRSLPGGRAVVGAFLVVLAAVGTFGAYLQATAAPSTAFLVASSPLEVGRVLTEQDVASRFDTVALDLPDAQSARAVRASQRQDLVGTVVVAPVAGDDLLLLSAVQPIGSAERGVQLSLSLPPARAIGGQIAVGERVDVIGTFGAGGRTSRTQVVARQVAVVAAPPTDDGITGGRVMLTVQVPDLAIAQRLQHAADVADIAVVRGADGDAPDPDPVVGLDTPDALVPENESSGAPAAPDLPAAPEAASDPAASPSPAASAASAASASVDGDVGEQGDGS